MEYVCSCMLYSVYCDCIGWSTVSKVIMNEHLTVTVFIIAVPLYFFSNAYYRYIYTILLKLSHKS